MNDKEQLQKWQDQWEKAMDTPEFQEDRGPQPTQKTSDNSYFGIVNPHSTEEISKDDAAYWNRVLDPSENMLNEESDQQILAKGAKAIAQSPNPVRQHTIGKDQDMTAQALGLTYSDQDIQDLTELKLQLHTLECKLNEFESRGKNAKKFEAQIQTLKNKIDELSDSMGQTFPFALSPQGD